MKYPIIATLIAGFAAGLAGCGADVSAASDAAAACMKCHTGPRTLGGREAEALAEQIRLILDGEVRHPPLGLDDDSDEAILALAAELAAE